ncbi:MAG: type II toxin-antitoxin system VapB family antitoxin [Actinomycetota bacterium]
MSLNIKDPSTDQLVRELAAVTGESITEAVAVAVRERLDRLVALRLAGDLRADIERIVMRCAELPELDARSSDEILGYDADGLPA